MPLRWHLATTFSLPGQPGFTANQAIVAKYGNGGSLAPPVPVVTLPVGTTVDHPAAKAALARGFTAVSQIKGVRVASYFGTADRHFVSQDGRTTYGLVFRPVPATSGFSDNDIAGQRPGVPHHAARAAARCRQADGLAGQHRPGPRGPGHPGSTETPR